MKKIIFILGILILVTLQNLVFGASGQSTDYIVINTTNSITYTGDIIVDTNTLNTVAFYFPKTTREIFAIKTSTTGAVYINYNSTYTVIGSSYTFALREGVVDWHQEDIYSTRMSLYTEDEDAYIRFKIKY